MTKKFIFIKFAILYLFLVVNSNAMQNESFDKGIKYFENNEFKKSKIYFERDLVFNPKNERSYLYLAKIYNNDEKINEEEVHLNNVLLLNPQNDEALYLLTLIKINQSDYNSAKDLIAKFSLVCESFCAKKNELEEKFNKLIP